MNTPTRGIPPLAVILVSLLFTARADAQKAEPPARTAPAGTWTAVAGGFPGSSSSVWDLAVFGTDLIAAGLFSNAGGVPVSNIAAWNGTSWSALGAGVNGPVYALTIHDGRLIAVGGFSEAGGMAATRVAAWDGSAWSNLGAGVAATPYAAASYQGRLFVGTSEGLPPFGVQVANLNEWLPANAAWFQRFTFLSEAGNDLVSIQAVDVVGDRLFIGGEYLRIRVYDGTNLSLAGTVQNVRAVDQFGGNVVAGATDPLLSSWDGAQTWTSLNPAWDGCGVVSDLQVRNGLLHAAGSFAGPCGPNGVITWDGTNGSQLGSGMNGSVLALAELNGVLFAGGYFTTADGQPALRIAQWNDAPVAVEQKTIGGVKALFRNR